MVKQNVRGGYGGLGQVRDAEEAKTTRDMWKRPDATPNYEGGLSFKMDAYTELYTRVASCFFGEPSFYKEVNQYGVIEAQNQDNDLLKLARGIATQDPEFVLKLAAYARNELNLRTISTVLWTEVAIAVGLKKVKEEIQNPGRLVRQYAPAILQRADEPGEAIAYYIAMNGSFLGSGGQYPNYARKGVILTHAMQKGIEDAIFANFDRYKIAKYDRTKAAVKWRDTINLVHPKPNAPNRVENYWSSIFKDVLAGTIEPAETWEDTLMNFRQKGFESKKAAWESIIPKMPYMATLRNLKNFIEEDIGEKSVDYVIEKLRNPEEVKRSKQFPYRFYTAYLMLDRISTAKRTRDKLQSALEDAIATSVENNLADIKWQGTTAIASDWSASMDATLSAKSIISRKAVGGLMQCMSYNLTDSAYCMLFGQGLGMVHMRERDGILSNLDRLLHEDVGHSTNAFLVPDYLLEKNIFVDRLVLFSDMQCYNTTGNSYGDAQFAPKWKEYKKRVNPNAYLYSFNLAGYGTSVVPQDESNTCLLGGFTDKVLQFVKLFEQDKYGALDKIRNINAETYHHRKKKKEEEKESDSEDDTTTSDASSAA